MSIRFKNVPFRFNDVCDMPLVPLRGKKSTTHWRLHPTYTKNLLEDCDPVQPNEEEEEEEEEAEVDDDDKTDQEERDSAEGEAKDTLKPKTVRPIKSPTSSKSSTSTSGGVASKSDPKALRGRTLLHDHDQLLSSSSSSSSPPGITNSRKQRYLAALNSKATKNDIVTKPVKPSKPSLFSWITGTGGGNKQPTPTRYNFLTYPTHPQFNFFFPRPPHPVPSLSFPSSPIPLSIYT